MQGSEKHADTHTLIAERLMSFIRDDLRYCTFPKLAIGNKLDSHSSTVQFGYNFCEYFRNFFKIYYIFVYDIENIFFCLRISELLKLF